MLHFGTFANAGTHPLKNAAEALVVDRIRLANAFASESGFEVVRDKLIGKTAFDGATKESLIGVEKGFTQPEALDRLVGAPNSRRTRPPFGAVVLTAPGMESARVFPSEGVRDRRHEHAFDSTFYLWLSEPYARRCLRQRARISSNGPVKRRILSRRRLTDGGALVGCCDYRKHSVHRGICGCPTEAANPKPPAWGPTSGPGTSDAIGGNKPLGRACPQAGGRVVQPSRAVADSSPLLLSLRTQSTEDEPAEANFRGCQRSDLQQSGSKYSVQWAAASARGNSMWRVYMPTAREGMHGYQDGDVLLRFTRTGVVDRYLVEIADSGRPLALQWITSSVGVVTKPGSRPRRMGWT